MKDLGFRVWGFGLRVWGSGFRVRGLGRPCHPLSAQDLGNSGCITGVGFFVAFFMVFLCGALGIWVSIYIYKCILGVNLGDPTKRNHHVSGGWGYSSHCSCGRRGLGFEDEGCCLNVEQDGILERM